MNDRALIFAAGFLSGVAFVVGAAAYATAKGSEQ